MSKKTGLGQGLGALIRASELPDGESGLKMVPLAKIVPNPHQPRSIMDEEKLVELAASIKEHGLIQPLIVTQDGDNYTLIAGERRWRASQLVDGLTEVPVVIKEATPQAMLELAIIENIQRADLNPLEEAYAYQQLMNEFDLTQDEVAKRVGKGRSTVANLLRLLKLPQNVQQAVIDGRISGAHARALLPLPTPEAQTSAMNKIIHLNLSVRQAESLVKVQSLNVSEQIKNSVILGNIRFAHAEILNLLSMPERQNNALRQVIAQNLSLVETKQLVEKLLASKKQKPKPKMTLSPELVDLQKQFEESLGTPVNIQKGDEGGKVVIHYYSDEELQGIYEAIVGGE